VGKNFLNIRDNLIDIQDCKFDKWPTQLVNLRLFVGSSSGMFGIRYLEVFDYASVSWCATGLARESEVYFPQMEKNQRTSHSYTTTA